MTLDQRRLSNDRYRFDHVWIERSLRQELDVAQLGGFGFEHIDERGADDLALGLRVGDVRQALEEQLRGVREDERQLQALESLANLRRLVQPQHAVVDEDARQLVADGAMNEQRGDRGIHSAAQRADDASIANA